MLKKILLTGFCVAVIASSANAAAPAQIVAPNKAVSQVTKPIYVWKTESEKDPETNAFDHCLVKNMYDNGTAVILAQNLQGSKRLALQFPKGKMQAGQHFDLAIQVDRKDVFPVEAVAVNAQILTIGIPDGLPDQMRKGQMLHVRGPNDEVIYDLNGMEGAVAALQDCMIAQNATMVVARTDDAPVITPPEKKAEVKTEAKKVIPASAATKKQPEKQPEKLAAKEAPTPSVPPAPFGDNKIIQVDGQRLLPEDLHYIYSAAGLAPEELIPLKSTGKEQPLDYLWQQQSVFAGFKKQTFSNGQTIDKVSVDYLKMLRERCKGNFLAESTSIQATPSKGMTWQATEAACSSSTKGDSIAAILFTTTPKGAQIFFFESSADQGAGAIKSRDAIQAVVTQ